MPRRTRAQPQAGAGCLSRRGAADATASRGLVDRRRWSGRRLACRHAPARRKPDARARHPGASTSRPGSSTAWPPTLVHFYRHARPARSYSPAVASADWRASLWRTTAVSCSIRAWDCRPDWCATSIGCNADFLQRGTRLLADASPWPQDRRRARRPAARTHLARRSGQDHRLPGVQCAAASGRSVR